MESLEDETTSVAQLNEANMPTEIFFEILKYLNFDDIKNVKLVCKRWLRIVDNSPYCKKLTWFINSLNCYEMLGTSRHFASRVKFRKCCIDGLSMEQIQDVLRLYGYHIEYLELREIHIFHALATCSSFLPNLATLNIKYSAEPTCPVYYQLNLHDLKNLKKLDLTESFIDHEGLMKIFKSLAHPLNELHLRTCNNDEVKEMLALLKLHKDSLKSFGLFGYSRKPFNSVEWKNFFSEMTSLNYLQMKGNFQDSNLVEIFGSRTFNALKEIDLTGLPLANENTLMQIKNNCPNLKILKITCSWKDNRTFAFEMMEVLDEKLGIKPSSDEIDIEDENENRLQELYVSNLEPSEHFVTTLAESFVNLRVLDMGFCRYAVRDSTLQLIFKNLTNLIVLLLDECKLITDQGLVGKYGIDRLSNLQALSIHGCEKVTSISLETFNFKKLKFLDIGGCKVGSLATASNLIDRCPALEIINFRCYEKINRKTYDTILQNYLKFKNTRHEEFEKLEKLAVLSLRFR